MIAESQLTGLFDPFYMYGRSKEYITLTPTKFPRASELRSSKIKVGLSPLICMMNTYNYRSILRFSEACNQGTRMLYSVHVAVIQTHTAKARCNMLLAGWADPAVNVGQIIYA